MLLLYHVFLPLFLQEFLNISLKNMKRNFWESVCMFVWDNANNNT